MQAEDRPIHFSTELMHIPKSHAVPVLQRLYFDWSQSRVTSFDNIELTPPGPPKFYSRRGEKTHSAAVFLPDRILFAEEWVDLPMAQFLDKVDKASAVALDVLEIPAYVAQTVTIRTTFALTHFQDARVFLIDNACRQAGRIGPHFQRPIAVGGLRFVLPETPDHPGTLHIIIESYRHGLNEVYIEVKGIFPNTVISAQSEMKPRDHVQRVRSFISSHIYPYLNQFDQSGVV
ncbi:MAG: hypothetical protein AMXMBFR84_38790 [Candidatus Hydrogenedentota bacterium]